MYLLPQLPLSRLAALGPCFTGPFAESIELLVLQPTSFCNIDCDYCYLSNRNDRRKMSLETIRSAVRLVIDSHLVKERLCVVWHAGEPLVLPVQYYDEAFAAIQETVVSRCEISHSIQSNGTLIDDLWCQFLMKHRVRIGLSIDGPALIHDAHRKTRNGKGSHALAMRG